MQELSPSPREAQESKPAIPSRSSEVQVRPVDFRNPDEVRRIREIASDPNVRRYLGDSNDPDTLSQVQRMGLGKVFAVTENRPDIPSEERNAMQGWVYFGVDRSEDSQQWKSADNTADVYSVSYAKHPKARSGQMAQAVRMGCMAILAQDVLKTRSQPDVVAYAEPDNIASWHVLEAAGFKRVGELVKQGDINFQGEHKVYAYKLDWKALSDIMQAKETARLFTPVAAEELALAA